MDDLKQNIRKWNHDILTHMIGITYLMDMQRYPEAEQLLRKNSEQSLLIFRDIPSSHHVPGFG